jgi:formate-dependent nitrite reductase membrane component NrfD
MFKSWSPMSVGAWALLLFGAFSGASFLGALAEDGRFGLRRFSGAAGYLHKGPLGMIFQVLGCLFGFFIASYTGALLTASNQPFWSDSPLIGGLFLASAASTGIAALLLVLSLRRGVPSDSVANLERTDRWAMLLELVMLIALVASLGSLAPAFVGSIYGILLIVVTLALGVIVPLVLSWRTHPLGARSTVIAAVLVLIGGLALRYAIVMAGQQVAVAGR